MPGSALNQTLLTPEAKLTQVNIALIGGQLPGTYPTPAPITIGTAVTAAATSQTITVTGTIPIPILAGQYLLFEDAAGSYLFEVSALQASGAVTALTGFAIEDIPAAAVARFPCPVYALTTSSSTETVGTSTFSTYGDKGGSEVARGDETNSLELAAGGGGYNAGILTAIYAKRNAVDVFWSRELPNDDASAFATPAIEWGAGIITNTSTTGGQPDKFGNNATISINGQIRRERPVAI